MLSKASKGRFIYYNLKENIYEELVHGIRNFNYGTYDQPLLKELEFTITYIDSKKSTLIRSSDMIAGTIRRIMVDDKYSYEERFKKINDLL